MAITVRDFDTMVDAVLDRIVLADVGITDTSKGSVIRTIVESIVSELDIQYYQIEMAYASKSIDDAEGDDLDALVAILSIIRDAATYATTTLRFSRTEVATSDILILSGTVCSTNVDNDGNIYEFETVGNATLSTGNTYIDIAVKAVNAGSIILSANQVVIMSDPVTGIESVTNQSVINSGTDEESDDSLRARAKAKLTDLGKGTNDAIRDAILDIDGISLCTMLDMNRGVGTSDALIVGNTMPVSADLENQIKAVIADVKASGIDVQPIYPTIVAVNVTITTSIASSTAGNAILSYFNSLSIGESFIVRQMERFVLNTGTDADDITTSAPTGNVTATSTQILEKGTITINGVVWNG